MPIKARCSECGKQYEVADRLAGKSVKCRACGTSFAISSGQRPVRSAARSAGPADEPEAVPASRTETVKWVLLAGGAAAVFALFVCGGAGVYFAFFRGPGTVTRENYL